MGVHKKMAIMDFILKDARKMGIYDCGRNLTQEKTIQLYKDIKEREPGRNGSGIVRLMSDAFFLTSEQEMVIKWWVEDYEKR